MARRCVRAVSSRAGTAHVGMLQVFRLEAAGRPAGPPPRLLFPSGLPAPATAAATLAEVATRGETVLLTEQVLRQLLGSEPAAAVQLSPNSRSPVGGIGGGSGAGRRSLSPPAGAPSGLMAFADLVLSGDDSEAALVAAGPSTPLAHVLAGAAAQAQPDWSATAQPTHEAAGPMPPPTDRERELLAAAADGDTARLRSVLQASTSGGRGAGADALPAARLLATARMPPSGASALHLASLAGVSEAIDQLLLSGASVHATAINGSTALHWAAAAGHLVVVKRLLAAGASGDARTSTWCATVRGTDTGQTPAHWAAATGQAACLAALLEAGAHALLLKDERDLTPAGLAAREGHEGLQHALSRLEGAKVVCIRVHVEMSATSPVGPGRSRTDTGPGDARGNHRGDAVPRLR
eukprot:scaffold6283_cov127-Isochrysis_galbana.AAC.8